jgi:hypothetical protein
MSEAQWLSPPPVRRDSAPGRRGEMIYGARCAAGVVAHRRGAVAAVCVLVCVCVMLGALVMAAPSSADPAREYSDAAGSVRSLRTERGVLMATIASREARLDATRARLAEMNLTLRRAESEYDEAYAQYERSLVAMYKLGDRIVWVELVDRFGLDSMSSEYDFFSRVAAEHRRLVEDLRLRQRRVAALRTGIADLKSASLSDLDTLRDSLAGVQAALDGETRRLRAARAAYEAADDAAAGGAVVQPGLGGLLAAANEPPPGLSPTGRTFAGLASWYGPGFQGKTTASGESYDMYGFTCASRTLPFGTWLRVTYQGRAVFLRVNDRGPVSQDRVLDLSYAGATALGFSGVAYVEAEIWAR